MILILYYIYVTNWLIIWYWSALIFFKWRRKIYYYFSDFATTFPKKSASPSTTEIMTISKLW